MNMRQSAASPSKSQRNSNNLLSTFWKGMPPPGFDNKLLDWLWLWLGLNTTQNLSKENSKNTQKNNVLKSARRISMYVRMYVRTWVRTYVQMKSAQEVVPVKEVAVRNFGAPRMPPTLSCVRGLCGRSRLFLGLWFPRLVVGRLRLGFCVSVSAVFAFPLFFSFSTNPSARKENLIGKKTTRSKLCR